MMEMEVWVKPQMQEMTFAANEYVTACYAYGSSVISTTYDSDWLNKYIIYKGETKKIDEIDEIKQAFANAYGEDGALNSNFHGLSSDADHAYNSGTVYLFQSAPAQARIEIEKPTLAGDYIFVTADGQYAFGISSVTGLPINRNYFS